jgi:hypothetical protein
MPHTRILHTENMPVGAAAGLDDKEEEAADDTLNHNRDWEEGSAEEGPVLKKTDLQTGMGVQSQRESRPTRPGFEAPVAITIPANLMPSPMKYAGAMASPQADRWQNVMM